MAIDEAKPGAFMGNFMGDLRAVMLVRAVASIALSLLLSGTAGSQERIARVGFLSWQDSGAYYETTLKGFVAGLRDEGYVEGKNLELLRRSPRTMNSRSSACSC